MQTHCDHATASLAGLFGVGVVAATGPPWWVTLIAAIIAPLIAWLLQMVSKGMWATIRNIEREQLRLMRELERRACPFSNHQTPAMCKPGQTPPQTPAEVTP